MDSEKTYIISDTHHQCINISVVPQKAFLYPSLVGTDTGRGEIQHVSHS